MKRARARADTVSTNARTSIEGWLRDMAGLTVFQGHARFEGPDRIRVGETFLSAPCIFINVGGRASVPNLPGIDRVSYAPRAGQTTGRAIAAIKQPAERGNRYLRTQLIHGARDALGHFADKPTSTGAWVRGLMARSHRNVVVVALAATHNLGGVVIAAVSALSIYYLVRGQPLLVQGEVDATRFDIAARVDGRVGEIPVTRGQNFAANAVLVRIDDRL